MSGCCASRNAARPTVHGCFERGLATRRLPPLKVAGERIKAASGLWAAFSLSLEAGRLDEIRFAASTCTTLIAYCQALVELSRGQAPGAARVLDAEALAARLPGVPAAKHDRAVLAVAALRAALVDIEEPSTGGDAA